MTRRLKEDYACEPDSRSFDEKYGDSEVFEESELNEAIPENVRKLFESILENSQKQKLN